LGPRVFIVEDDRHIIELYSEILKTHGYELAGFALNGKEAVETFRAMDTRPDVIIMDQRLPLVSGVEATKEIMRIDPSAKVLFVSADITSRESALQCGAADFIRKPFEVKDFVTRLEALSGKFGPK
jgi:two-component system chemotaxis response regulator CheY